MKHLLVLALCSILVPPLAAQRRGGGGFHGGGGSRGGGFRGGGAFHSGGGFRGGIGYSGGFRSSGFRNYGYRGYAGYGYGYYGNGYYGYPLGVGYYGGLLDYYGGYVGSPYISIYPSYYPQTYQPSVLYLGNQDSSPSPAPVIINQFSPGWSPQPSAPAQIYEVPSTTAKKTSGPPIYLIARNDETIVAALSFEVQGSTLRYTTLKHESRTIPLNTVDRALSEQLNTERSVPFALPPPSKN